MVYAPDGTVEGDLSLPVDATVGEYVIDAFCRLGDEVFFYNSRGLPLEVTEAPPEPVEKQPTFTG